MTVARALSTDITAYIATIYADAVLVARENMFMSNLVYGFGDRTGLAVRSRSQYGTATINTIGEDDDLSSQAFTPSVQSSLTPAEAGAQFFLTDSRIESDPFQVMNDASQELGMAVADKVNVDLLGDFNTFEAGTIGASGSALTWNYVFAMQAVLRVKKAPLPYRFVCTPYQFYRLGIAASVGNTVTNAPSVQEKFASGAGFYQGTFYGIDFFTCTDCEVSSTDAYAGMFSPSALALDVRRAFRLEPQRDASRRGWELNASMVYAHGVWRATWGVAGIFTNAAVTGV